MDQNVITCLLVAIYQWWLSGWLSKIIVIPLTAQVSHNQSEYDYYFFYINNNNNNNNNTFLFFVTDF